jgi:hypothetical protein
MWFRIMKFLMFAWVLKGVLPSTAHGGAIHAGHPQVAHTRIRWGTSEGHVKFYEKMVSQFNRVPNKFTQRHHLMSRALRFPGFNQAMTNRLLTTPARFIANHICFSKFLDGQLHEIASRGGVTTGSSPPSVSLSQNLLGKTQPFQTSTNPQTLPISTGPNTSPTGGPTYPSAVPEPSSFLMLSGAMVFGVILRCRKRPPRGYAV